MAKRRAAEVFPRRERANSMSDISKLIEAMRVSGEAGGTRGGEANPILPLGQPLVWMDGKLVKAPDAPRPAALAAQTEAPAPKAADKPAERAHESARTPAEGASPGPRQAEGGRDKK